MLLCGACGSYPSTSKINGHDFIFVALCKKLQASPSSLATLICVRSAGVFFLNGLAPAAVAERKPGKAVEDILGVAHLIYTLNHRPL